jgi:hypothetical protein
VLEIDDRVRRTVEQDLQPLLELGRGDHHAVRTLSVVAS